LETLKDFDDPERCADDFKKSDRRRRREFLCNFLNMIGSMPRSASFLPLEAEVFASSSQHLDLALASDDYHGIPPSTRNLISCTIMHGLETIAQRGWWYSAVETQMGSVASPDPVA
jgi:hypothetical protein